ncbi:hypothetical protein M8C21_021056, partial [Ambrosia artemisiifolia]
MKKKKVKPTYNNAKDVAYIPDNDNDDNSEEDQEVNISVEVSKKALKENQSRSTVTMGELLSKTQRGVLSKKAGRPNSIKDRSKEQLNLVDEDDDWIFQDGLENDENMLMNSTKLDGLENDENEGDVMRSQADQDEEDEDIEEIIAANNNMNMDDSSKDSENEDDVHRLEIEQIQRPELGKAIEIPKSKKRGPTMLHVVHTRTVKER